MLSRRPDEAHGVLVFGDGDVVGGSGFAEACAESVEFGTEVRCRLGFHGDEGVKQSARLDRSRKSD